MAGQAQRLDSSQDSSTKELQVEVKGSDSLQEEENERGGMTAFFSDFGGREQPKDAGRT